MVEIWKDIKGYEGLYQVSNLGRVKSVARKYWNANNNSYSQFKEKIKKPHLHGKGYLRILLSKDCKQNNFLVHRLVAEAFIPNPNNLPQVNHKDEDKTNNFVHVNSDGTVDPAKSNLEWCDNKYNCNYGQIRKQKKSKCRTPVCQYDLHGKFIKSYEGAKQAEKETGVCRTNITACCRGLCEQRGGFIWKYKDAS